MSSSAGPSPVRGSTFLKKAKPMQNASDRTQMTPPRIQKIKLIFWAAVAGISLGIVHGAIAGTTHAQDTINPEDTPYSEKAFVIRTQILPLAGGLRIIHHPAVDVAYAACDPAAPDNEAVKAQAALQATELTEAARLELNGWTPGSRAHCERRRYEIRWFPTITSTAPATCTPDWVEGFDWSLAGEPCP